MAFKMKGFSQHKGTKVHVGSRKGSAEFLPASAAFQKASAFKTPGHGAPSNHTHETTRTEGEPVVGEWQTGETKKREGGGTTREDWRDVTTPGETVERIAETPEEIEAYKRYLADVEAGKVERNTKYDESVERETRVEETEGAAIQGNLFGRGGTSNVRVHGSASDLGYTGSMEVDPDKKYNLTEAITSYVPEIYEGGKYKGRGDRVEFKDFEFYDNPEFQQLLTNVNFETVARGGTKGRGFKGAQESDYGQALMEIASSDNPEAAYADTIERFPELVREGGASEGVNPVQNQSTGSFVTGSQAKGAASYGSGYKKLGGNRTKSWI